MIRQPRSQFPAMRKSHSKRWSKRKSSPSLRKKDFILPKMIGWVVRLSSTSGIYEAVVLSTVSLTAPEGNSRPQDPQTAEFPSRFIRSTSNSRVDFSTPFDSASHLSELRMNLANTRETQANAPVEPNVTYSQTPGIAVRIGNVRISVVRG